MNGGLFNMISLCLISCCNVKQYELVGGQPITDEHEHSTLEIHLIELEDEMNEYLEDYGG